MAQMSQRRREPDERVVVRVVQRQQRVAAVPRRRVVRARARVVLATHSASADASRQRGAPEHARGGRPQQRVPGDQLGGDHVAVRWEGYLDCVEAPVDLCELRDDELQLHQDAVVGRRSRRCAGAGQLAHETCEVRGEGLHVARDVVCARSGGGGGAGHGDDEVEEVCRFVRSAGKKRGSRVRVCFPGRS